MIARPRRVGGGPVLGLLAVLLAASVTAAVTVGPSSVGAGDVWRVVGDHLGFASHATPTENAIVWEIRLPRVLLAATVGAGLALVGAVMQATMRNPLADPYLLGISAGASFGAVVVFVGLGGAALGLTTGAFGGAMVAFVAVLVLGAGRGARIEPGRIVLAGVAVASLFDAATALLIIAAAEPEGTRGILYWLLGSLAGSTWSDLAVAVPLLAVAAGVMMAQARPLNAMAIGDDDAAGVGVDVSRVRWLLLVTGALLTGALVAVSGAIGFVGLLLPHATRLVVGRDHRFLLPAVALVGATFLVWVDTVARTAFDPQEIPVGVTTALIGAPAFAFVLARRMGQR
jgi:iron complex transport system permease protein